MKRSSPMKRTGFARKPDSPFNSLANRATAECRTSIKRRTKRPTRAQGSHYLDACRNECCYLRVPGVCTAPDWAAPDVVPCHSNLLEHGKGKGLKANHECTFPGCGACHFWLDQSMVPTKQERRDATHAALARWRPVRARKMNNGEA